MGIGWLDGIAILVVAYNAARGLSSGLIRSLFSLGAIFAASFFAWRNHSWGATLLDSFLPFLPHLPASLADLANPSAVWLTVFLPINTAGILLSRLIHFTPLALADRIGGLILGLLSGLIFLILPLLLIATFPLLQQISPIQTAIAHSQAAALLGPLCQTILNR
ncbi:MAG TPA: CvpA family protein [Chroococcales cyanobacterium]|jgi:uncharacterized membrane protein required for colicin V production